MYCICSKTNAKYCNCLFIKGGGIYLSGAGGSISEPTVMNNLIKDNAAESLGGGIYVDLYCSPTFINNTICGNTPDQVEPNNYPNNIINNLCN